MNTVEYFDGKSWKAAASMGTARWELGTAVYGGMLYAVGGNNGAAHLNTVEYFDGVS